MTDHTNAGPELSTEESIEALMDDDGFLPGDEDFTEKGSGEPEDLLGEEEEDDDEGEGLDEDDDDDSEDGGESDEDDDDEDGDEGESEDAPALSDETLLDLQIGEDVYEVNLAELKSGYLRNEEFVTKMEELNEEHAAKVAELEQRQEELVRELEIASVVTTGDLSKYDNIDWENLKAQDPAQYNALRLEALDAREAANAMVQRRNAIAGLDAKAKQLKHEAYVKSQMKIAETLIPELKEESTRAAMVAYALEVGFTQEDIMGIADAKTLLILNNARLYAESQVRRKEAKAKKVTSDLPKAVRPGTPKTAASAERMAVKNSTNRLRKEQSVEAAAAHFMNVVNFD